MSTPLHPLDDLEWEEMKQHSLAGYDIIKDNKTIWSFTLEPTTAGTRVVQRRETPDGTSRISDGLIRRLMGGQQAFLGELRDGMRQTLHGIKVEAEA